MKIYCSTKQLPALPFCGPHFKPHVARGLSKHYHLRFDPKLGNGEFAIFRIMFNAFQSILDTQHGIDIDLQDSMSNPMESLDDMQGDPMYFHQTMAQEDSGDFVDAVVKEVNGYVENAHWKHVPAKSVPEYTDIFPSIWYMQIKRNIFINEITKYKAGLNVHGGNQTFGENFLTPTLQSSHGLR